MGESYYIIPELPKSYKKKRSSPSARPERKTWARKKTQNRIDLPPRSYCINRHGGITEGKRSEGRKKRVRGRTNRPNLLRSSYKRVTQETKTAIIRN